MKGPVGRGSYREIDVIGVFFLVASPRPAKSRSLPKIAAKLGRIQPISVGPASNNAPISRALWLILLFAVSLGNFEP